MMRQTMRRLLALLTVLAAMEGSWSAGQEKLRYMALFPEDEMDAPHVMAPSQALPQDFVDAAWQGIIAASDGRTYFGVSSHSPQHNAQFYRYDPASNAVEHLADLGTWCGETETVGEVNTQGRVSARLFEADGRLYGATTSARSDAAHPYKGGHFLSYDLASGACADLGTYAGQDGAGLTTLVYEPVFQRLYAIHQGGNTLICFDLKTKQITALGSVQDSGVPCRALVTDTNGVVYGSDCGGIIFRYDPRSETMSCLLTQIPCDPEAPQPKADPKAMGWRLTQWVPIVWDPASQWWYGIRGNDEFLFRFRPPADPRGHRGEIEGLTPLGFRESRDDQPRQASLGLAAIGRRLYYSSHGAGRSMAHLMSYSLDTGRVANHGPIVTDGRRRVSEIQSLAATRDGKLHAVAMVWSIEGKDPAKPWSSRSQCYFHPRFMVIDPAKDCIHSVERGQGDEDAQGVHD